MNELSEALRQIGQGFLALAEAVEKVPRTQEVQSEPEAQPEPERRRTLRGENLRRAFRDWVAKENPDMEFTWNDLCEHFGISYGTARRLLTWAEGRIIQQVDEITRPTGGIPTPVYRYRRRVDDPPVRRARPADSSGRRWRRSPVANQRKAQNKEVRELLQKLKPGFRYEMGGEHIKVYDGNRLITTVPNTPSDHRSLKNARAKLRREGAI